MESNSSGESRGVVRPKRYDYCDEFGRIVYIMDELNNAKYFGKSHHPNFNKLFLAGYIPLHTIENSPDLIKCFQELPMDYYLEEESEVSIQLCNFLLLLRELRRGFEEGVTIDPSARWDILKLFLNIVGPRRELISRVLYYLYAPHGLFVPKEEPGGPSEMADATRLYPTENLAFSLFFKTQDKLQRNEYRRYLSIWDNVRQRFEKGRYSKKDSVETWRQFSEALSAYKDLKRLLAKIPWPHLTNESPFGAPYASDGTPAVPAKNASHGTPAASAKKAVDGTPAAQLRFYNSGFWYSGRKASDGTTVAPAKKTSDGTTVAPAKKTSDGTPVAPAKKASDVTPATLAKKAVDGTPAAQLRFYNSGVWYSGSPCKKVSDGTPAAPAKRSAEDTPATPATKVAVGTPSTPAKRSAEGSPPTPAKRLAVGSPSTPTRKSSADEKTSARSA